MISIALIFGAPETVPAGNIDLKASNLPGMSALQDVSVKGKRTSSNPLSARPTLVK